MRKLVAALLLLGLGACATASTQQVVDRTPAEPAPPPAPPTYQDTLDRLGVDFQVPEEGKVILVNIPAYELIAFEDGEPVLRSRVIVGTPRLQTPVMWTEVEAVRYRPPWAPSPEMIQRGEYPPGYYAPPGPNNPFGLLVMLLDNNEYIHMHDTNNRSLFGRDQRALSHGCVRVERWDELAAWILGVEPEAVHDRVNRGYTYDEPVDPIPVYLGYFTSFPGADGEMAAHPDVYGLGTTAVQPMPEHIGG